MDGSRRTVSVILTVKNDRAGCEQVLQALRAQTRRPDEIVVADGGSTDGTSELLRSTAEQDSIVRIVEARAANIARGRNAAAAAATGEILACTDAGCRPAPDWLERIVAPLESAEDIEFVAGFYRVDGRTLREQVIGLATMPGQLDRVCPARFNPSARSLACTRELWHRAGGWPAWLNYSEDTLFDHKVRALGCGWRFVPEAIVAWRPRTTWRALARQFFRYGTGRGHTQIGAADHWYNLRNLGLFAGTAFASLIFSWMLSVTAFLGLYFYVWTFHPKAVRIARATRRRRAYLLCLAVMWVVLVSNLAGYLVGSWRRWCDREHYQGQMQAYLATAGH